MKTRYMAPKTKFPIDDIVDAALAVVRRDGLENLTTRAIAGELQSSTMPIYSCGKTITEIEVEVVKRCWGILADYQKKPLTNDIYIDMGLGYVLFAKHENHLFGCIHSSKHVALNKRHAEENFIYNLNRLKDYTPFAEVTEELRLKIMMQGWIFCHGLADLLSKNLSGNLSCPQTDEELAEFVIEANKITYIGIKKTVEDNIKK